ncbi:MAG: PaaI family thioesterase [Candidatus Melainabacteria bacterium]|nr:PaaI family thioesterase [Candidatus Melainabacteria bacterium]MBI3308939.1 PaaI family thioesterase [Candidatus Melainabacteria bacterium]
MSSIDFDKHLGLKVVKRKKGYCKIRLDVKPKYLNRGGIVHGGVLATLCDVALAGAVATAMREGQWCVTVQLQIEYMNPAFLGEPLFGYGKLIRAGRTLAFVEGGIETKSKVKITKAQGIWYIKKGPSKKLKTNKKLQQLE